MFLLRRLETSVFTSAPEPVEQKLFCGSRARAEMICLINIDCSKVRLETAYVD